MEYILLVDFGSTYTKLSLVSRKQADIVVTSKSFTTVETDIMNGFQNALANMKEKLEKMKLTFPEVFDYKVCSSAAGGLKMSVSGLVKELTAEAAKLACLGSGAKILDVYSNKLTKPTFEELLDKKPDMLLLSGGTDGGNSDCILHNASLLAQCQTDIPVVVAGNNQAQSQIQKWFEEAGINHVVVDNVMPRLNELNIEPARESIRQLFMERIIDAKGLGKAKSMLHHDIIPTPLAVLRAAELLAVGTDEQEGWGELMIVDVGGATTDVHSICKGTPSKPTAIQVGLVEPFVKRTVEGDLGMRVSAQSLYEAVGARRLSDISGQSVADVQAGCTFRAERTNYICQNDAEFHFDNSIASCAVELSVERHAGKIEAVHSPMGMIFYQKGKDLSKVKHIIGTGGVLVHSQKPGVILEFGLFNEQKGESLKPLNAKLYLDVSYILSSAGLLAKDEPDLAMKIMTKHIKQVLGENDETDK